MRVPSVGLSLDERRFVNEGYRLAEHLLRDYRDPPSSLVVMVRNSLADSRQTMLDLYRAVVRD